MTYTKDLLLKHGFSTGMNEKILYALHIVKKLKDEPTLGLGEEKSLAENIDNLESAKVKEAALDDKLSIELRSIVQQIQVLLFSSSKNLSK